ncbi:MAG: carbohydrate ABC transporter permease [Anaerolineae bacterium]|nr:carbohydrate ABC transporter permease [Anaerolineae bacterium]
MASVPVSVSSALTRPAKQNQWRARLLVYALLAVLTLFFVFPFYAMVVASFMHRNALNSVTPNLFPNPFILDNYTALFSGVVGDDIVIKTPFVRALFNSAALAIGQTIPALFFTSLVGFIFAKRRFPGRNVLFLFVLITMMLPYQSTIVPFFLLMSRLGWINTFLPLWIPWWAPAFGVFLMRQIISATIPDDLIDAAAIDGTSLFGTYWRIVLPLIKPAIAVFGILNFMNAWNDYIYSNIVLNSADMYTVPLVLSLFKGATLSVPQYGVMAAGSVIATIPLVIVFFMFQRWLISGIMSGALKA